MSDEYSIKLESLYFDPQGRIVVQDKDVKAKIIELIKTHDSIAVELEPLSRRTPIHGDVACPEGDGDNACPESDNCPDMACPGDGDSFCPDIDLYCPTNTRLDSRLIYQISPDELIISNGRFSKALIDAKFGPAKELLMRFNDDQ